MFLSVAQRPSILWVIHDALPPRTDVWAPRAEQLHRAGTRPCAAACVAPGDSGPRGRRGVTSRARPAAAPRASAPHSGSRAASRGPRRGLRVRSGRPRADRRVPEARPAALLRVFSSTPCLFGSSARFPMGVRGRQWLRRGIARPCAAHTRLLCRAMFLHLLSPRPSCFFVFVTMSFKTRFKCAHRKIVFFKE